jgi:hypothetical protein
LELGLPTTIEATSTPWGGDQRAPASYPMAMLVHYQFPARGTRPPVRLSWYDGGLMPERPAMLPESVTLPRDGGVIMVGDRAILVHETYGGNPRIYPEARFAEAAPEYVAEVRRRDAEREAVRRAGVGTAAAAQVQAQQAAQRRAEPERLSHEMDWIEAIRTRREASSPFSYAAPLTEVMLLGIVALRAGQGRTIAYDAANMRVTNVPEAERWLRREYRAGWTL